VPNLQPGPRYQGLPGDRRSECTFYEDRRLASKTEMEEIAWYLTTRKAGRAVGFISADKFREEREAAAPANEDSAEREE